MKIRDMAARLGGTVEGPDSVDIVAMAALDEALPGDVSFCTDSKYAKQLAASKASVVLVPNDWAEARPAHVTFIRVADPNGAFAQVAPWFAPPPPERKPGIHPTAIIGANVTLGKDVHIGPYTVIENDTVIGDRCVIECQVYIGPHVTIGEGGHVYPQVTIREGTRIGKRVILHSGVRLGGDGYGFNPVVQPDGSIRIDKIPQIGVVELGNDVEIGCNTTIDRARFGRTRLGNCVKLDNLVQIGHNVQVGDYSGIIAQAGVAGSTIIGSGCLIWAQAGISGHIRLGDRAQVGPASGLSKSVPAGEYYLGLPAMPRREFATHLLAPHEIEKLKKKIAALEERLAALQSKNA